MFGLVAADPGLRVFVFPDYRHANPYQRLLYGPLETRFDVRFLPWRTSLPEGRAPVEPTVFHLHWEDAVYRDEADEAAAARVAQSFIEAVETQQAAGVPIFWTAHNEQPHDGRYAPVHQELAAAMGRLADMVIVHHPSAAQAIAGRHGLEPERIAIVPHGHYRDVHTPLGLGRQARRAAAGFGAEDRVLLLFGRLDSYKGATELLAAMAGIEDPRLRLIVAGKQVAPIDRALAGLPPEVRARITLHQGFVADHEVARLFDLADFVVAPYRTVLTSGTVMLAFSLERPVIVPDLPGLLEWVRDGDNGIVYPAGDPEAMRGALERALAVQSDALETMRGRALESALRHDWANAATLLGGLYAAALLAHRSARVGNALDWFVLD